MFKIISRLLFLSLLSLRLYANNESSYHEIANTMILTPANELEFRILKLNFLLNHPTNGIVRDSNFQFSFPDDEDGNGFSVHFYEQYVKSVYCYNDLNNPKNLICEVVFPVDKHFFSLSDKEIMGLIKAFYKEIFEQARSIIHPTFDHSNLKFIVKLERIRDCDEDDQRQIETSDVSIREFYFVSKEQNQVTIFILENGPPSFPEEFVKD